MASRSLLTRAGAATTLIASALFVLGVLYASVALHQLDPIWSPDQQLLLTATMTSNYHAQSQNKNSESDDTLASSCWDRSPPVWPHSLVVAQQRVPDSDSRVGPSTTITYYDYDQGGNLIQDFPQNDTTKSVLWDLELNTGHSYYFHPSEQSCKPVEMPVGILRPTWLEGATPMGPSWSTWRRSSDKASSKSDRLVCGWTKLDFIDYYEDASTGEPDSWYFHNMKATFNVLNYTASATIDPALFVPPDYCFS